jgi:TP901 family phage tail tape measure protein
MTYKLGSAVGTIKLTSAGVNKGVTESEGLLDRLGSSTQRTAKIMTTALLGVGAVVAGSLTAVAVSGTRMAMDLEEQMSAVKAVMGATDEQIVMLKDHILELGMNPELKVTTMEAAEAIEMLGRNGLDTQQILDGAAESTVMLANATGGTFAQSADIATDIMALFNIEAANMEAAVDGVTAVVNNSKWSIDDYEYALAAAGGVAAASGVEFDDMNTSIAAIAPFFNSGRR